MYYVVWEYEVGADQLPAFETLYGPTGAWSQLFHAAEGYGGTELYRDTTRPTHFVTVDRWATPAAFEAYSQPSRRPTTDWMSRGRRLPSASSG